MYSSNVQKSPASTVDIPTSAGYPAFRTTSKKGNGSQPCAGPTCQGPRTWSLLVEVSPHLVQELAGVATTEATWPCRRWLHRTHDLSHGVTASTQRPSSFILRHPRNLHDGPGSKPQMINHPKPSHGSSGPCGTDCQALHHVQLASIGPGQLAHITSHRITHGQRLQSNRIASHCIASHRCNVLHLQAQSSGIGKTIAVHPVASLEACGSM